MLRTRRLNFKQLQIQGKKGVRPVGWPQYTTSYWSVSPIILGEHWCVLVWHGRTIKITRWQVRTCHSWSTVIAQDDISEMIHCPCGVSKNILLEEKNIAVLCALWLCTCLYITFIKWPLTFSLMTLRQVQETSTNHITADALQFKLNYDKNCQSVLLNYKVKRLGGQKQNKIRKKWMTS